MEALAADEFLDEIENRWRCDDCMKTIKAQWTCMVCGAPYREPGEDPPEGGDSTDAAGTRTATQEMALEVVRQQLAERGGRLR